MRGWLAEGLAVVIIIALLWIVFKLEVWGGFLGILGALIVGTVYEGVDAQNRLEYAKAVLYQGGSIVFADNAVKPKAPVVPINSSVMKNGEVRKLPTVNSPMWTTQWAVQGTAKAPYIVSKRVAEPVDGSVTDQGWACSCPNFTQHSPRTECKHILKVMLTTGAKPNTPPVASLPEDQQEAFQKFLRQQAAAGTPALPAGTSRPLFTKGRKFR